MNSVIVTDFSMGEGCVVITISYQRKRLSTQFLGRADIKIFLWTQYEISKDRRDEVRITGIIT